MKNRQIGGHRAEALQNAISIAADMEAAAVEPEHLLKALLDSNEGNLTAIIERIVQGPACDRHGDN